MADETPVAEWLPVATTLAGAALSVAGGMQAGTANAEAGRQTQAASDRAAAAYRALGVRQAETDRIKADRAKTAAEFAARQYEINAGQQTAAATIAAVEERRQANLRESRAIALAAASGAGASDPSVASIIGRIRGEGVYRANVALYQGAEQSRVLRMQAAAKHYEGLTALEAGDLNAGDILASTEASAIAEEAKGEAAARAGDIAAQTARMRGITGAVPATSALLAGANLFSKYWPTTGEEAEAAATAASDASNPNANLPSEAIDQVRTETQAYNDAAYDAWASAGLYTDPILEGAGAAADWDWAMILSSFI